MQARTTTAAPTPILVAEDDDNAFSLLEQAFATCERRFKLLRVHNGLEAKRYLAGQNSSADLGRSALPRFILLDLELPYYSGFEVLEWMQQGPELSGWIPIALSFSGKTEDVTRANKLGARCHAVRPGNFEDLVQFAQSFELFWFGFSKCMTLPDPWPSDARPPKPEPPPCEEPTC